MTKTPYVNLGLSTLVKQGFRASLEGKITLHDNIERHIPLDDDVAMRFRDFPIKIQGVTIFMFCLQGSIDIKLSFQNYRLKKNDIFIVQSGQLGEFNGMSKGVQFFFLFVHNDFSDPLTHINDSQKLQDLLFRGPLHHCNDRQMEKFRSIYDAIHEKIDGQWIYRDEVIRGYIYALLYSIYSLSYAESQEKATQAESVASQGAKGRQMEIYNSFISLVQKHAGQEHKTAFYADKLCITPKYLSQIIYNVSGRFAKDFIKESLVMESKALLKSGLSIQTVCDMLNFGSPSFFGRFFKEATGFTPFEYQTKE